MVRTISMDSTDGLQRGQDVISTEVLFRCPQEKKYMEDSLIMVILLMNENSKKVKSGLPIHREAPA